MKTISNDLWRSSRDFDIDSSSNANNSPFDLMVKENALQKTLESDDLIIVEGKRAKHFELTDIETLDKDLMEIRREECLSAGDFEEEYEEKLDFMEMKEEPELTSFEKSEYFGRIFPVLKI